MIYLLYLIFHLISTFSFGSNTHTHIHVRFMFGIFIYFSIFVCVYLLFPSFTFLRVYRSVIHYGEGCGCVSMLMLYFYVAKSKCNKKSADIFPLIFLCSASLLFIGFYVSVLNIHILWCCLFDCEHMAYWLATSISHAKNIYIFIIDAFHMHCASCRPVFVCPIFMIYQSLVDFNLYIFIPFTSFSPRFSSSSFDYYCY